MTLSYTVCIKCQKRYYRNNDFVFHEDEFNDDWHNRHNFWCPELDTTFWRDTWEYANRHLQKECPYFLEHLVSEGKVTTC
jgi:hypothetical protein